MIEQLRLNAPSRYTSAQPPRRILRDRDLFALVVLLPTLLAAVYFVFAASDRYVSETRFLVRSVERPAADGVSAVLRSFGLADASDPAFSVQSYLASRDALSALSARLPMDEILSPPGTDVVGACRKPWSRDGFEALYRCFLRHVRVVHEPDGGITRLDVDLYRAADAKAVADGLLELAEGFANTLNRRAEADALGASEAAAAAAEARTAAAQGALTAFRQAQGLLDVGESARASGSLTGALSTDLLRTRALIERQETMAPLGPALPGLRARANALETQVESERARLVGDGDQTLAARMPAYEALLLERDMAGRSWQRAAADLDEARARARRQTIYLDRIVAPNLPDQPIRPRRLRATISVAVVAFALFGMLWLGITGAREHADRAW